MDFCEQIIHDFLTSKDQMQTIHLEIDGYYKPQGFSVRWKIKCAGEGNIDSYVVVEGETCLFPTEKEARDVANLSIASWVCQKYGRAWFHTL